jgi:hypothetical protein
MAIRTPEHIVLYVFFMRAYEVAEKYLIPVAAVGPAGLGGGRGHGDRIQKQESKCSTLGRMVMIDPWRNSLWSVQETIMIIG